MTRKISIAVAVGLFLPLLLSAAQAQQDAKKWDVSAPTWPEDEAGVRHDGRDVDERRCQPRRTQIVFDLLGDIYVMPIGGGATPATRMPSGPAFDMQPRFSPDGKRIAFTSDRDGLWNIWTMDVERARTRSRSRARSGGS